MKRDEVMHEIYCMMDNYEIGIDQFEFDLVSAISSYLDRVNINYHMQSMDYALDDGGVAVFAFMCEDSERPELIVFEFRYMV